MSRHLRFHISLFFDNFAHVVMTGETEQDNVAMSFELFVPSICLFPVPCGKFYCHLMCCHAESIFPINAVLELVKSWQRKSQYGNGFVQVCSLQNVIYMNIYAELKDSTRGSSIVFWGM